jgi:hypothetical protein
VELFEQIRREFEFGSAASVKSVAKKFGVHRRMVRQALADANPPGRKIPERKRPRIDSVAEFIDQILAGDGNAPRKQKHTSHRIWRRIHQEMPENRVARIDGSAICTRTQAGVGVVEAGNLRAAEL